MSLCGNTCKYMTLWDIDVGLISELNAVIKLWDALTTQHTCENGYVLQHACITVYLANMNGHHMRVAAGGFCVHCGGPYRSFDLST